MALLVTTKFWVSLVTLTKERNELAYCRQPGNHPGVNKETGPRAL